MPAHPRAEFCHDGPVKRLGYVAARRLALETLGWTLVMLGVAALFLPGPGLLMHIKPESGTPRPVGKAIVDHLFGSSATGRVPVVGITGDLAVTTAVSTCGCR